ncbi:MAG: hypothetical protein L0Z62_50310 [Gemmataceae bacterium]|nr:hypothetical protein [Gemmataceae bacterium]
MHRFSFNLVGPAQDGDLLSAQRRRREHYQAVSRAWAQRRREYLRRLGLLARLGGHTTAATGRWAAS